MTVEKVGARISRVVDADTIALDIEEGLYRVRHIGMDTPGTSHPQVEVECFAPEAAGRNRELVQGQTLYLEKVLSETDQYGRLLRYVWLPDGRMVNEVLAAEGYALSIRREVCR